MHTALSVNQNIRSISSKAVCMDKSQVKQRLSGYLVILKWFLGRVFTTYLHMTVLIGEWLN